MMGWGWLKPVIEAILGFFGHAKKESDRAKDADPAPPHLRDYAAGKLRKSGVNKNRADSNDTTRLSRPGGNDPPADGGG